jgi:hypothetical protein
MQPILRATLWLCLWGLSASIQAQTVDPLALTPLADTPDPARASGLRLEGWVQTADLRPGASGLPAEQQRLVLDFRREWTLGSDWKLGLSDRVEQVHADTGSQLRNAWRESYLSWHWDAASYLDLGRIQWRNGVASGFNPSDFLKRGAQLDIGTQNPLVLRENRLGTVMGRQQWLSDAGSLQLGWIPQLSSVTPSPRSPRSPAWERTNGDDAALLRWAPAVGERWTAEGMIYKHAGEPLRLASNLTALVGDAWIAYAEWAGGRAWPAIPEGDRHVQELALGATWTSPWGWLATLERQQATTPGNSDAWFARWSWDKPLGLHDLVLASFARINSADRSRLWQLDARWNFNDAHSLNLSWGHANGSSGSEYGRVPSREFGMLSWLVYF